jgi:hypothetical protein
MQDLAHACTVLRCANQLTEFLVQAKETAFKTDGPALISTHNIVNILAEFFEWPQDDGKLRRAWMGNQVLQHCVTFVDAWAENVVCLFAVATAIEIYINKTEGRDLMLATSPGEVPIPGPRK